ncbi:hypothetical protein MNBD_IGNAVI01-529 [hydrothermal vent metagenome]|uniref:Glycoside hydrolase family 42 N-terminal domain-containing protein n=1 Tax=hydrothermal vent metagenome TaxID=652676 RepID=A0A3B1BSQ2_9ZZZZ
MKSIILFVFFTCNIAMAGSDKENITRFSNNVMPTLGCWFWGEEEFQPNGYKQFIDQVSRHSSYDLLTTSIRAFKKEVTDIKVHDQIKAAAIYAKRHDVPIVMDLDVRLARRAFEEKYPDELQEMLILQEVELSNDKSVECVIHSSNLGDHYTHRTTNYIPLRGSLIRVYSYVRDSAGIDPKTLKDITKECELVSVSKDSVQVIIQSDKNNISSKACVIVSFTHLTPDVFAPHIKDFQREIIKQYSDTQLAGVCKDEWGFPPNFDGNPKKDQFWYSKYRAKAYAERTNGRDLIADCLLMSFGIKGKENQRSMAINHFMEMSWQRNGDLEDDFYKTVKEVFGSDAVVATHPTWWPYPDLREFKKNGLDWWVATRDWAQTDELTPFAVRTALSKKWNSPIWYNMYYSKNKKDYERAVWSYALAGGRINFHRPYPNDNLDEARKELLRGNLMLAESRVHLLNFISQSQLDCPVAVVFGHASAMNWSGPGYNDVGMEVADNFWQEGFLADLIPSSEIENKNLYINNDGWICYGPQRYSAVILYNPEFEKSSTAAFFTQAQKGPTKLFRIGNWTHDFNGNTFNGDSALPSTMNKISDIKSAVFEVSTSLREQKIAPQTSATSKLVGFGHVSSSPPTSGFCRLIDGTIIQIAGTNNVAGDPIQSNINIGEYSVIFDALGVAAVRLDGSGNMEALAAGGLSYFKVGDFEIQLDTPTDIALWHDSKGEWDGVIQGRKGAIPVALLNITNNWVRLEIPVPLKTD